MSPDENLRRAVRFERPEWIPVTFHINPACWRHYPPEALGELMAAHPLLFPDFNGDAARAEELGLAQRRDAPYTDPWGCVWTTTADGITGTVTGHPLEDWSAWESFEPPDPDRTDGFAPVEWDAEAERLAAARREGRIAGASLPHGHTFMRLCDLRGYENLLVDMAEWEPRLEELIETVARFNEAVVRRFVERGADWVSYPEDLGMQRGPMLSPECFRRHIRPVYERLMAPAREAGCVIHMHSDGDIRLLLDDMIASGVEAVNLQDLVNGIDFIAERLAGRVCVEIDIDRQSILPRGTPAEIDALILEEVEKLGRREGGLMMIHGLYPGTPLENVEATMDAMERHARHFQ